LHHDHIVHSLTNERNQLKEENLKQIQTINMLTSQNHQFKSDHSTSAYSFETLQHDNDILRQENTKQVQTMNTLVNENHQLKRGKDILNAKLQELIEQKS
jgi:FtsZ-binding cell division protein ZapB